MLRRPPVFTQRSSSAASGVYKSQDLSDGAAIEALAKDVEATLGGIDILINNAGLTRDNLLLRMKDEEWQQILDINLTAAFRLTRTCLRGMMKRRWGRIIGLAAVVGVTGTGGQAHYGLPPIPL